ncbi:GTP-binding domain [Rhizobium phage RHph_N34]|uniref:Putative GTP-binding protein n=1 Tax=Rhizobium phage RHph_N34 TaxID=2509586 RepID=A0A7S5RAC0_9CAUD|nr:GTP-binding domain [Rhizobium phage RHph_N34]QIG74027.1 putative GTP-binding protein [Rhizobium phage RHph_N34]
MAAGRARGVDTIAEMYAYAVDIPFTGFPALWDKLGPAAGPERNGRMLQEFKPHATVAFPGTTGTAHMKEISRRAGVPVIEFDPVRQGLDI